MRARLLFVMIAGGCAMSAVTACSSPDVAVEAEARASKTTQASSVSIELFDKKGNDLGSCSGTLIAKNLVLTAGHCAAGAARWKIDSRGADATSEASRAVSPWKAFGSDLSHPDHTDIAVLLLDTPIELDTYPSLADTQLDDGAKAVRFSRSSANATKPEASDISVSAMGKKGFRLNYGAKVAKGGFVDTGGAIIDPSTGKIHGVVSGMGKTSGLLHIARTDNFATWLANALACTAGLSPSSGLATRTYGGSSSSSSSSSSSGGYGGGGGGWPGGDWGGYGGSGDTIDGGGATPGSSGGTTPGSSGSSGSSGGTSGSSGSSGSSGNGGAVPGGGGSDTSGSGSSCPGVPSCEGSDCPGDDGAPGSSTGGNGGANGGSSGSSGSTGSSGSSGSTGSSGSSGSNGSAGSSGSSGSSGNGGAVPGGGSSEVCPGPPSCPEPDSQACTGAACGGCAGLSGCVDATIDYGACASCGASGGTGTGPVVR